MTLDDLAAEVRACTNCAAVLPLGPRPILRVSTTATILIASQAPGTKVHVSGTPWTDASGVRLRTWLGMTPDEFYDPARVAILPMGLCYPGRLPQGGDCPPRPECAPLWRRRLLDAMPGLRLTLLVGSYAQVDALGPFMVLPVSAQPVQDRHQFAVAVHGHLGHRLAACFRFHALDQRLLEGGCHLRRAQLRP